MRAGRLLSFLMLLQSRGMITAEEVAFELGVSVRTVYRDVEALGIAGVPVYAVSGPGGGIGLTEDYRTDLTGLSEAEARALFMLSIPGPLVQLGVEKELRSALLKLSAALPAGKRAHEDMARQRIHIDSSWWLKGDEPVPQLGLLREAVWIDRTIDCDCEILRRFKIRLRLAPYGLVAKGGVWHLVAGLCGKVRVYRVALLSGITLTGEVFQRPPDFDLVSFWKDYCRERERQQSLFKARLLVKPEAFEAFVLNLALAGGSIEIYGSEGPRGWRFVHAGFESFESARGILLGLGGAAEVLEPGALRDSVRDYAEQIRLVYASE